MTFLLRANPKRRLFSQEVRAARTSASIAHRFPLRYNPDSPPPSLRWELTVAPARGAGED